MQSDPMAVLGLILISFEVFNLTTFLHNLNLHRKLFCTSVSLKLEKEQKRGMKGKGGGEEKDTLDRKPHDSEKNINVQLLIGAEWSC